MFKNLRAATEQLNKRQRRKRRRRRRPRLRCLRFLLFKLVCIGQGPAPDPRREACQGSHFEQEETEVTERPAAMPRRSLFPPFPHVQKSSRRNRDIEQKATKETKKASSSPPSLPSFPSVQTRVHRAGTSARSASRGLPRFSF